MTYWKPTLDSEGYTIVINEVHHKIHSGNAFIVSDYASAVTSKIWRITTPNTTARIHMSAALSANQESIFELYENPTITGAGTALTANNANRNSATAATATLFKDTTVSGNGTLIWKKISGANAANARVGGEARLDWELVLKQNEDYLFIATLDSSGEVSIIIDFYEE